MLSTTTPITVKVLDKGYISLISVHGTEQGVVDAARVSYDKRGEPEPDGSLSERDKKLLAFLIREGHTSPFRHPHLSFEVYAPLMVTRQWVKHQVASSFVEDGIAYNESSRRYVTENEEFYLPANDEWRYKPENSKQGSGRPLPTWESGVVDDIGGDPEQTGDYWTRNLQVFQAAGEAMYQSALKWGVAPEQARLFLPANGLYIRFYWTVSLAALINFLQLRDESHSQYEIQLFAKALRELTEPKFPETFKAVFA